VKRFLLTVFIVAGLFIVNGCFRGLPSDKPPIHLNPNMDKQPKYKAQEASAFFEDGSVMRLNIEGTVARGELREDLEFFTGKDSRGEFINRSPVKLDLELLKRGRERYDIFCSPCHSRVGDGRGMVVKRGLMPPPSFHDERIVAYPDGQYFDVITNGIRNMPSYSYQIPVHDRWAIIAFMRALQRSQNANRSDLPSDTLNSLRATE